MKNKGLVKAINIDTIEVEIFKELSCSTCNSCNSKTHGIKNFIYKNNDLKVGDIIEFEIETKKFLLISFLLYIFPILLMIIFYFIGQYFNFSEGKLVLLSFIGLFFGLYIVYFLDKTKGKVFAENIIIKKEKE